jgi:hypothetical protein
MSADIVGIGPTQAAELVDAKRKRRDTLRARVALLLGQVLRIVPDDEHGEAFEVGAARFANAASLEAWLNRIELDPSAARR